MFLSIETDLNTKGMTKDLKSKNDYINALKKRSSGEKQKIQEWKHKHNTLKDDLAGRNDDFDSMSEDIALLSEEIKQWKEIAGEMRKDYEEAIFSVTPEIFGRHWVKNVGKKGKELE